MHQMWIDLIIIILCIIEIVCVGVLVDQIREYMKPRGFRT